ncbi:Nicotinic acid phosphoribosyltransferase [Thermoplasmatales archaeon BRNA1]|nr:Nicotinic acid phosphoribosyltransferase [Thermoplasmatales archaeon BRNA1]
MAEKLFIADEAEVRKGTTMDVYFQRTKQILEAKGFKDTKVVAEFTCGGLPNKWPWAVFCGLEEVVRLMEGQKVDLWAVPEGTVFRARDSASVRVPLMNVAGAYADFGIYETAMLGMVCQPSGIATASARVKIASKGKTVLAFGNRRMHPGIAGVIDRSCYIGGCDGVASPFGADLCGTEAVGTVPHALMLVMGSNEAAFKAFDEVIDPKVGRVMLIDTFEDERKAAVAAAGLIKDLKGVRLDTPSSRRGNFKELINEVRWELDVNGYRDVDIIASGGLDENTISAIVDSAVAGFGVGTSIANAPTLDMGMDIIEKEGKPISKRGKFSGRKFAYRCPCCFAMGVSLRPDDTIRCPDCGKAMEMIEVPVLKDGKRVSKPRTAGEIRDSVLKQIEVLKSL